MHFPPSLSTDLVVNLTSDDATEATVPSAVTIIAGQTSAAFQVSAIDDNIDDSDATVTIGATSSIGNVSESVIVTNDETATLSLSLTDNGIDEDETTSLTLTLSVPRDVDTTIGLVSSDTDGSFDTSIRRHSRGPNQRNRYGQWC